MRKYLLKGIAVLAMGCVMTACSQDFSYEQQEQQASLNNAQQTLGFYIPENQDWVMSTTATATFNVTGLSDTDCTLYVFSNNPRSDGYGVVLASAPMTGTTTTISDFLIPQHQTSFYVGLKESDGNLVYKSVDIEDGEINASYDFNTTSNSRTRSIVNEIGDPFPSYTANEVNAKYKTSAPSTAKTWNEMLEASIRVDWGGQIDYNNLNNFTEMKLTAGSYGMSLWSGTRDIYVDGEVSLNVDYNNGINQARIYLLPNSTLNLNMVTYINDLEIYVANNATLNYNFSMLYKQTGGGIIFNRGTLNLPDDFQANQDAVIYNEGTVYGTNITSAPGDGRPSFFYNYGELDLSGNFQLNSCANFFNEGTVSVGGLSECTQGNSHIWWINKGHYTTKRFKIQAWNGTYYNYCQLLVQEDAYLHDGQFNLMSGSYMEAATADCNNFQVNMGGNAGFNIKGDSYWGAQGDGIFQGFKATGENNYVRLGGTTTVAAHKYSLVAEGKVFIGINALNDLGKSNTWYGPDVEFRENTKDVEYTELNPTYDAANCGATWTSNPPISTTPTENQSWTYAFEDNKTRCDFDLNDVVIQVRESETDDSQLIVTLVAAGCEYDNYVWLGEELIAWPNGAEVHDAFGANHGVMVNTGNGKGVDMSPVSVSINKPNDFDFQSADFKIRPYKINSDRTEDNARGSYITIQKAGVETGLWGPLGLAIPGKWKWPNERIIVNYAYPDFTAWGKTEDLTLRPELSGWYQNPTSGLVYGE